MRKPAVILVLLVVSGCAKDPELNTSDQGAAGNAVSASGASAPAAASGAAARASGGATGANTVGTAGARASNGSAGVTASAGATASPPNAGGLSAAGGGGSSPAAGSGAPPAATIADCPVVDSTMGAGTSRAVTVDATKVIGTIRSLQGAHWDPGPASGALSKNYVAMGVDLIRTHDGAGINGSGAGDVDGPGSSRMFPSMSADATVEASYNFGPTDTMLKNMRDTGAEIYFRVGRSNISGGNTVPTDFDKYGEIVKHIVMHYNQGWAKGFMYGIRYFEIWNEPDFTPFWTGTAEQYHELYGKIARAIKAADPAALIGGPANSTFNDKMGTRAGLLAYIKDNQLPLDFYSFHKYTNKSQDPMDYARMAQSFRDELDMFGFTKAEIVNSEFETSLQGDVMLGGEAGHAAFTADAFIYMQNGHVDKSTSYMQIGAAATKESLAFAAISKLKASPTRLCAQGGDDNGFGVMAGISQKDALLQVVIANYQISKSLMGPIPGGNEEELTVPGIGKLADMTYPERRTFSYADKDGYDLTIGAIPDSWGDLTVKQYRIDASNNFALIATTMSKPADRAQAGLKVSGKWARAAKSTNDPTGAAQGVDFIAVTGSAASTPAE